jgi:hypothetical protein
VSPVKYELGVLYPRRLHSSPNHDVVSSITELFDHVFTKICENTFGLSRRFW